MNMPEIVMLLISVLLDGKFPKWAIPIKNFSES